MKKILILIISALVCIGQISCDNKVDQNVPPASPPKIDALVKKDLPSPPIEPAQKEATIKESGRDSRYIYENGTVLDTRTNLMWAANDNGSNINWANAKSYCENYRGGGYTDWRMPTQDELAGLYDSAVSGKNGYRLTNFITLTRCCPWASETRDPAAAIFYFNHGFRNWNPQSIGDGGRVLPVRSAK